MRIEVAAGILRQDERVLLTERIGDSPFAGLWEFPGGKLDEGECAEAALRREIAEELGVDVIAASHLMQIEHHYADRRVRIDFFLVDEWCGNPSGLDGQALRWIGISELSADELLPADAPVVEALRQLLDPGANNQQIHSLKDTS